ncbi:MAG: hypothetical protein JXB26_13640 [Candidatus Aminicenantes bacterium]|nr:hypothetical protein [Candidatus Aminicenantes bacterium]
MNIQKFLRRIKKVRIPEMGYPVEQTLAKECQTFMSPESAVFYADILEAAPEENSLTAAVADGEKERLLVHWRLKAPDNKDWIFFGLDEKEGAWLLSSRPCFLYAAFFYLAEVLAHEPVDKISPWLRKVSLSPVKSTFDLFLTQYARKIRRFDREAYVKEYARLGFTHVEVNGLAGPEPYEMGIKGEFYRFFYTYCPALDQFVSSRLNRGLYPASYLRANLKVLKRNAGLAVRYGLKPGLLCFEPRSVPDSFFKKYPTLRGARVDHPFRSFKPRYNLALKHPLVREHYGELMHRLMKEVPDLEFLTIWTNDSGAGFEHTRSLYVGRNGGAYLIREWKDEEDISRAAAGNVVDFFEFLRDSARKINPDFRIITRLEPFYGERKHLWPGLQDGIDVEGNSLLTKGWESVYHHPSYKDIKVLGSALHNKLLPKEKRPARNLEKKGSRAYFYQFISAHGNHEPLLGIPFPWLVLEKLSSLRRLGLDAAAPVGGIQPPDRVPFAVNQMVFRRFQFEPLKDAEKVIQKTAVYYVGEKWAETLLRGWKCLDEAVRFFPPMSIYTHYGVVWQRLFVRPLVPDIDRIPEKKRRYYERHMCAPIHNPNRIDLARDVLFDLVDKDYARIAYERIDENIWNLIDEAEALFQEGLNVKSEEKQAGRLFLDHLFRTRALRCLFRTLRNTAVWIYAVHSYMDSMSSQERQEKLQCLREMIDSEIANTRDLLKIWGESPVEWMIVSGKGETPFIYGENFPRFLRKKILLMEKYKENEPFIDPLYMYRVPRNPHGQK